ncbi:MAG: phosphonoacetaldehyde reductase [Lachnospiraceae bacterium]|jgi:alcohol dehydrogenase class IV|nr:phosphonoacetaldehyde reductase [Lachnospiraceae bacterium]
MAEQIIFKAENNYNQLQIYLNKIKVKNILLVCESFISQLQINDWFKTLESSSEISLFRFSDFQTNPQYSSVVAGVELFRQSKCDCIIAVGGGSAIDVAKCIKLFSNMDPNKNYLDQVIIPNNIKLIAIPTTAGTGSESTRFAVIYYEETKQSISDDSCIPSFVLFDSSAINTLPAYYRKASMLDALCHAIESFWSVNSTEESRKYSRQALQCILENMDEYLRNDEIANMFMLKAANLAGRAINIAQTTAGHAMCYKLTSFYGIAHGHACALCVAKLWGYMIDHGDECIDPRGKLYLQRIFQDIADAMGCSAASEAPVIFQNILNRLELPVPCPKEEDYFVLINSVNSVRMKNNPVKLSREAIDMIYHQILEGNY